MIDDVFSLARSCTRARWFIVTDDDDIEKRALQDGLTCVRDEGVGLNEALTIAAEHLSSLGVETMLVLPMDAPLTTCADLETIFEVGETSDVVVVPSIGDGGTNALLLRPPGAMEPRFGPKSLEGHLQGAERLGLRATVLPVDNLSCDLDTAEDLRSVLETSQGHASATLTWLRQNLIEAQEPD